LDKEVPITFEKSSRPRFRDSDLDANPDWNCLGGGLQSLSALFIFLLLCYYYHYCYYYYLSLLLTIVILASKNSLLSHLCIKIPQLYYI